MTLEDNRFIKTNSDFCLLPNIFWISLSSQFETNFWKSFFRKFAANANYSDSKVLPSIDVLI